MSEKNGTLRVAEAGVARVDAADDRRVAVADQHRRLGFLLLDRRVAAGAGVDEVRLVAGDVDMVMEIVPSLVTCGLTLRCSLASTNCVCAPMALTTETGIDTPCVDVRLDVVHGGDARRGQDANLAGALHGRQAQVQVEGAGHGAERQADGGAGAEAGRGRHVDEEVGTAALVPVPVRGPGTRPSMGDAGVVRAAADADVVREDQAGRVAVGRCRRRRCRPTARRSAARSSNSPRRCAPR